MLDDFTVRYLDCFFGLQKAQWENYLEGASHDLGVWDRAIYDLCKEHSGVEFGREPLAGVAQDIVLRSMVDRHPDVSALRNRLDDPAAYATGCGIVDAGELLASRMEPDVLALMQIRQLLSRELGFKSYPELVFRTERLNLQKMISLSHEYLRLNLRSALTLVNKYDMCIVSWFKGLSSIGGSYPVADRIGLARDLCRKLGLTAGMSGLKICTDGPFAGYVGALAVPEDVRLTIRDREDLQSTRVLFHELGHSLSHTLNSREGLAKTWTSLGDEGKAQIFELLGVQLMLRPSERERVGEIALLENVRLACSFLFEMDLWQSPECARDLYLRHFGALGAVDGDAALWCLDSFRSVDSVYIHNYLYGSLIAQSLLSFLQEEFRRDYRTWGRWLHKNVLAPGRLSLNLAEFLDFSVKSMAK